LKKNWKEGGVEKEKEMCKPKKPEQTQNAMPQDKTDIQ